MDKLNRRMEKKEKRFSEPVDRTVEIAQPETTEEIN